VKLYFILFSGDDETLFKTIFLNYLLGNKGEQNFHHPFREWGQTKSLLKQNFQKIY